jgi:K(+)-stimulated pyrophosphate-energized sodium pump
MNILIKLTCLIGLVIAPILGGHSEGTKKEMKHIIIKMHTDGDAKMGQCDMTKCATMTKDECAKMCDSLGCSAEEKAMCIAQSDANGNNIAKEEKAKKLVNVQMINKNGKFKATVTVSENGKQTIQVFEGTEAEVKAKVESLK